MEKVFLVGPVFQKVSSESGFKAFANVDKLIDYLKREPLKGNTILIKGSRGMGLKKFMTSLEDSFTVDCQLQLNLIFIRRTSDLLPDLTLGPHNPYPEETMKLSVSFFQISIA